MIHKGCFKVKYHYPSELLYNVATDLGNDHLNIAMQDPQVHQHTLLDI